jgi:hypothetical protein
MLARGQRLGRDAAAVERLDEPLIEISDLEHLRMERQNSST